MENQSIAAKVAKQFHTRRMRHILDSNLPGATEADSSKKKKSYCNSREVSHNAAMPLTDTESSFSGNLKECCADYIDIYNQMSRSYSLTRDQKKQCLCKKLSKDALQYYLTHVEPVLATNNQSINMINAEYNSPV